MNRWMRRVAAPLSLAVAACSGDSPTEPPPSNGGPDPLPVPAVIFSHSLSVPDSVAVGERVPYSVTRSVSGRDGSASIDSAYVAATRGSDEERFSALSDTTSFVHAEDDVTSLESCVYATVVNADHRVSDVDCITATVGTFAVPDSSRFRLETRTMFYRDASEVGFLVTHPESGEVYEVFSVDGVAEAMIPESDSLLVEPMASGEVLHVSPVDGRSYQWHLFRGGDDVVADTVLATDAYAPVLTLPFRGGLDGIVESVPVRVSALLMGRTVGSPSNRFRLGDGTPVGRGAFVSLDRAQSHDLWWLEGPYNGLWQIDDDSDFGGRPHKEVHDIAMDMIKRVFDDPRQLFLPYGTREEIDEFLVERSMPAAEFVQSEYFSGIVSDVEGQPRSPVPKEFQHLHFRLGISRTSGGYSYENGLFRLNNSRMHTAIFFPGGYFSESFLLGGAESQLLGQCSEKNKIAVPNCRQDPLQGPDGNGIVPEARDRYVTFMARDQVFATQFNHLFGVAIEDAYQRTGFAFNNDDTHWLSLDRLVPGESGLYVPASLHGVPPEEQASALSLPTPKGFVQTESGLYVKPFSTQSRMHATTPQALTVTNHYAPRSPVEKRVQMFAREEDLDVSFANQHK